MKLKKIMAASLAATLTASAIAVSAFAANKVCEVNKNVGWDATVTITKEYFEALSKDMPYIVAEVASAPGDDHTIRPLLLKEDASLDWDTLFYSEDTAKFAGFFHDGRLNEDKNYNKFKDSNYVVENKEGYKTDKVIFEVPANLIDRVKNEGIFLAGTGVKVLKVYVANEAPTKFWDMSGKELEAGADAQQPAATTTTAAGGNTGATTGGANDKNQPNTGIEGVAVVAGLAVLAAGALVISKKRK